MKSKENLFEDYYGGLYYLEKNKDKELTIFIIDDDDIFREILIDRLSENLFFSVHGFSTGEKAIRYLSLNPDFIILDYHLDGKYSYAKKGDIIFKEIKEVLPEVEIMVMSSDFKLGLKEKIWKQFPGGISDKNEPTIQKMEHKLNLYGWNKWRFKQVKVGLIILSVVILTIMLTL